MTETAVQSASELGRLLAAAQGYKVLTHDGAPLGSLEGIRYEQQVSHPDEIVVTGRGFRRRRRTFPFDAVGNVSARDRTVVLRAE
ncbi:MAG: hypothetical protein ACYDCH_06015 [Gaiellaceae bacterium]